MNFAICLGYKVWYAYLPCLMLSMGCFDIYELLSPGRVDFFKLSEDPLANIFLQKHDPRVLMEALQTDGSESSIGEACTSGSEACTWKAGEWNRKEIFDPLGIVEKQIREEERGQVLNVHEKSIKQLVLVPILSETGC